MNKALIKTCVIGYNYAKTTLIPILKENRRLKIIGICTKSKNKELEKSCNKFSLWKIMINSLKPELVVIAVPPKIQSKIIKYLIKKKISFFAQKPLTYNFYDAQIIRNIFKNYKNIKMAIDLNFLELEPIVFFRKIIEKNAPNKDLNIEVKWLFKSGIYKENHWKNKNRDGGGMYYNFGFHLFSIIINLFGDVRVILARKEKFFDSIDLQTKKKKIKIKVYFSNSFHAKNIFSIKYLCKKPFTYELLNTSKDYHGNFLVLKNKKIIFRQSKNFQGKDSRQVASSFVLKKLLSLMTLKNKKKSNENHYNLDMSIKVHSIINDIYKFIK
jgi:predicted dehydrogenase